MNVPNFERIQLVQQLPFQLAARPLTAKQPSFPTSTKPSPLRYSIGRRKGSSPGHPALENDMKKLAAVLIASLFTTVAFAQASAPAPTAPAAAASTPAPAHKSATHMKKASHHTMHKKAAETAPAAASAAQ